MNHKLEEWARRKVRPLLKKDLLITLILGGVLILVISLPSGKKKESEIEGWSGQVSYGNESVAKADGPEGKNEMDWIDQAEAYKVNLEGELKRILSAIDGVGEVQVMIMLGESRELVVEKEQKEKRKETKELIESGERTGKEDDLEESAVIWSNGNQKQPFVVKEIYPRVEGVVIVAEGVGTGYVRSEITEAVQALFGLEAHKIKVLKLGLSR